MESNIEKLTGSKMYRRTLCSKSAKWRFSMVFLFHSVFPFQCLGEKISRNISSGPYCLLLSQNATWTCRAKIIADFLVSNSTRDCQPSSHWTTPENAVRHAHMLHLWGFHQDTLSWISSYFNNYSPPSGSFPSLLDVFFKVLLLMFLFSHAL